MTQRDYRITALNTHGHWTASFEDSPERGFGGATAREAAQRLIKATARVDLDSEQVREVSATESNNRLELVVQVTAAGTI